MQQETSTTADGADDVGRYLAEASRTPLLTAAEEIELAQRIEVGCYAEQVITGATTAVRATRSELEWLVAEGARARERFISANLRLVVSVARRYVSSGVPLLDLVQEGNTGLLRAVDKFDHTKGFKFSTYANWWIRQFILRSMNVHTRAVRVPIHVHEQITRLRFLSRDLGNELGRDPSPAELAAACDLSEDKIIALIEYERTLDTVSLDMTVDAAGSTTFGDLMTTDPSPGPEDLVLRDRHAADLRARVAELEPRLADIVTRRYGLDGRPPAQLNEIGERWQITAQRVRQLLNQALARLRDHEAELAA